MSKFKVGDIVSFITKGAFLYKPLVVKSVSKQDDGSFEYQCYAHYSTPDTAFPYYENQLELIESKYQPASVDEKPLGINSEFAIRYANAANAYANASNMNIETHLKELKKIYDDEYVKTICSHFEDKKCECGKEKHGFASHSNWCPLHE